MCRQYWLFVYYYYSLVISCWSLLIKLYYCFAARLFYSLQSSRSIYTNPSIRSVVISRLTRGLRIVYVVCAGTKYTHSIQCHFSTSMIMSSIQSRRHLFLFFISLQTYTPHARTHTAALWKFSKFQNSTSNAVVFLYPPIEPISWVS